MLDKIWKAIKVFFNKIFNKTAAESQEETTITEVSTPEGEALAEHIDEKMDILLPTFTEEERDALLDIIRPIIKRYNSDDTYLNICKTICELKTLKTFASLSEDQSTLIIKLTQSNIFNSKIADFINENMVSSFKISISDKFAGNYEVTGEDGIIMIKKVR